MVMADVLQMNALSMPYAAGFPADGKDAYIGWLTSEFAAANAIIDCMCQHVQSLGSPGDYETVFSCLNRRRHTWMSTLYMQQFLSVADIVNTLDQVAQKKRLSRCSPLRASAESDAHYSCYHAQTHEQSSPPIRTSGDKTKVSQHPPANLCYPQPRAPDVSEDVALSPGNAPLQETGDVKSSVLPTERFTGTAEINIVSSMDGIAPSEQDRDSSTTSSFNITNVTKAAEQETPLDRSAGLNVDELLNMEVAIAPKEEEARHALIKRSVQFQCCELVDGKTINDGESVELCEGVFSSKEVDELVNVVVQLQAAGRQGALGCAFSSSEKSGNKPDIIRFGPKYEDGTKINGSLCMPKSLQAIVKWLTFCGILSAKRRPDSSFISIFNEGDFESPNADQGAWERPLCVISLSGDCTMVFGHVITADQQGSCKGPFEVTLPIGSVLLLQEKFAGILQKAVPASPSRRITIALGKATSSAGQSHMNSEGKVRNKQWWGSGAQDGCRPYVINGTSKQARLVGGISMDPIPHILPYPCPNGVPLPSMQPIFPFLEPLSTVPQGWAYMPCNQQSSASSGTGVFLPSIELSSEPMWQSGLLMSFAASSLEARSTSRHLKRGDKHAKVRGSLDCAVLPRKKQGKLVNLSLPDEMGTGINSTTTCS